MQTRIIKEYNEIEITFDNSIINELQLFKDFNDLNNYSEVSSDLITLYYNSKDNLKYILNTLLTIEDIIESYYEDYYDDETYWD